MNTNKIHNNILENLNEAQIEELYRNYNDTEFLNYTLESGRIGYALLFLYHYEKKNDEKYLEVAKSIVFEDIYFNNNNISLHYGLTGAILAQLYYYYITDDSSILKIVSSNIEKVICNVKVMPKKHFMNPCFKEGVTGIMYLYTILQYSNEKNLFEQMLLLLNKYVSEYLKSETDNLEYNDIGLGYSIIKRFVCNDNLLLLEDNIKYIRNDYTGEIPNLASKTYSLFEHILFLASTKQIVINLDINNLCKNEIQQFFPRTVELIGNDYNFSSYFGYSLIETLLNFCNSFTWQDEVSENFFVFEKAKFYYELELRDLSMSELIKKNNDEVLKNISYLCLHDNKFLEQYFKCSDDLLIIETNHYKTLEIEEDILEASTYVVALKPRTIPFNELYISECCLEDSFKFVISFNKMEEPIRGQDLVEIAYEQDISIDYNIVKDFVVNTLRKLVLYRLLTIENAETEKL